jgi:hypothetical protein
MSSGGTSDNVATRTFDSLIGDNSVSLVSSSSIPARVSSTLCIYHLHVAHWSGFGVRGLPLYPLFRNTKRLRESGNLPLSHPATPSLTLTPQFSIYKADLQAGLVAHVLLAHHGYSESRRKTISCIFSKFIEPITFKTFYP